MYVKSTLLAVASLVIMARAGGVDFDLDDSPQKCRGVCRPIANLARLCSVDLPGDDDRLEDQLEAQCFCTNLSFDVDNFAAVCRDCIRQNMNSGGGDHDDDDDHDHDRRWRRRDNDHHDALEDINAIFRTCAFSGTSSFVASATAAAESVTVTATRPTDASELTTTFSGGSSQTDSPNTDTGKDNGDDGDNAAGMVVPSLWMAVAAVVGGAALLV